MAEVIVNVKANTGQATNSVDDLNNSLNQTEQSAEDLSASLERQEARIKTLGGAINILGGSVELLAGGLAASGALTEEQVERFQAAAIGAIAFADGAKRVFEGYKELGEGIRAYGGAAKVAQAIQAKLNLTVLANPYVAAAAALAAVTAAVYLFIKAGDDEEAQLERLQIARERYNKQLQIEETNRIALLRASGADAVTLAQEEEAAAQRAFEAAQNRFVLAQRENQFSEETAQARLDYIDAEGKLEVAVANTQAAIERKAETEKLAAEREAEQRKRNAEARQKDAQTLAEELAAIQREAELALLEARDREIKIATETYNQKLALLQENGQDTSVLTEAFNKEIAGINERYDKEEKERREAKDKELEDQLKIAADKYAQFLNELAEAQVSNEDERRALEITKINEYYDKLIADAKEYGLDTEQLEKARQAKITEINEQGLEQRTQLQKAFESDQAQAVSSQLDALSSLTSALVQVQGEGSKEAFEKGKKYKIADVVTSSTKAAFEAFASAQQFGPILGPILGAAQVAAIAIAANRAIGDIKSSTFDSSSISGGGAGAVSAPAGFNPAGLGGSQQTLVTSVPPTERGPMRAYVVAGDVTTSIAAENQIQRRRTL